MWRFVFVLVSIFFLIGTNTRAYSNIEGNIKDAVTDQPLPGANIILIGTSLGDATDINGKFTIRNVPPGSYTIRVTYIGYKPQELAIQLKDGTTLTQDFALEPVSVEGETIIVTAQASGQNEAINQQLSSMQIKNIVSLAKIQELPDNNAAESIGRLPGVSLIRTGGEGSQVVIRGLSPQYNQITIDGVEMSSNIASGNNIVSSDKNLQLTASGLGGTIDILGDRGTDLSMISSSMLGGIEVTKAITPDMDAAVLGGVVNFGMRKAVKSILVKERGINEPWLPFVEIVSQGGYQSLKDTYSNYKFVGSIERRFFDDESFGVFVQGSTEKRNLSANELGATYNLEDKTHGDVPLPLLNSLNLTDVFRERERHGATAVLDYQHQSGEIGLMNFFSTSKTNSAHRSQEIRRQLDDIYYSAKDIRNELNVFSNLLSIKQDIPLFHVDLKLSHSYSESVNPEDLYFNFWQDGAGLANQGDLSKVHPNVLASLAVPDAINTNLDRIETSKTFSKERSLSGSLDFQTEMSFSDLLTSKFKFGGSYQYRTRSYDYDLFSGSQLYSGGGPVVQRILQAFPQLRSQDDQLSVQVFQDDYDYGNFLDGEYNLAYPSINIDLMRRIIPIIKGVGSLEGYRPNILATRINDYSGDEKKSAVYGMFAFNIGEDITILPGVRYQNLTTTYTALRGKTIPSGIQGKDTTISQSHGYLLPMVHLKYKPLDWFQIHFAYTNTLNYPDYSTITPRYLIEPAFINYNNWRLKPARSENFDIVLSFFNNEVGLFAVDGFKKRIKDLIFFSHTFKTDLSEYPDLPQGNTQLYEFNTYINNPITIDVYGFEADWQTHFWYLPVPFSGFVFNINYTHIFSEAGYPKSEFIVTYDDFGNPTTVITDTFYTTRLLNQPNDILNLALGYDFGGFSGRISMLYQDNIFKRPDFFMQNRVNSDKLTRFDLSIKQTLPWFGIQLFFNLNNITGEMDTDINQKNSFPASEQHYDMTGDLGLRIKL
jgi:TonB-dependent receptor